MKENCRRGFTLVELLVVIAIIGILIALLLPAVQAAREAARRSQCANNMKQVALGLQGYHSTYNSLPHGTSYMIPNAFGSWITSILPFIEQYALYDKFDFTVTLGHANNAAALNDVIPTLICPSDHYKYMPIMPARCLVGAPAGDPSRTHVSWYLGSLGPVQSAGGGSCPFCPACNRSNVAPGPCYCCQGSNGGVNNDAPGMFSRANRNTTAGRRYKPVHFADVLDGLAYTIVIGETLPTHSVHNQAYGNNYPLLATNIPINTMRGSGWNGFDINPENYPAGYHDTRDPMQQGIKSMHPGGAQVGLTDGSVRYLSQSTSFVLLNALGTRKGGEAVQ